MPTQLKYGAGSTVSIDLPPDGLVAECGVLAGIALDDPAAAIAVALADPLGLPPLSRCILPDDCVAITLEGDLPRVGDLLAGAVQSLLEIGISPSHISVLRTKDEAELSTTDPRSGLPAEIAKRITLVTHDPLERDELAYLAVSADGNPICLNRAVTEADVVLPIGCLRLPTALGYYGIYGGLFPAFADAEAQKRLRTPGNVKSSEQRERRRHDADEVAWLLGITIIAQVVPAGGNGILHVLAGDVREVLSQGEKLYEAAWNISLPERASLVVAGIEGDARQQTWDNVARALAAARRAVADGGTVALCTALASKPGPALEKLAASESYEDAARALRREKPDDSACAEELLRTLDCARVYLLSDLDEDLVEEWGIAHVSEAADISRLCRRHDSCIVLSNAQYAVPTGMADEPSSDCGVHECVGE